MAKRLSRGEKEKQMVIDMINEMFRIAGHNVTYDDIKDRKDNWYTQWTMTMAQNDEWQAWGKKYLQKNLRMYAKMAERQMAMISLMWGLKFSDLPSFRPYDTGEAEEVKYELGSCLNCEWDHDMCPHADECLKNTTFKSE